jgi:arginine deiminase
MARQTQKQVIATEFQQQRAPEQRWEHLDGSFSSVSEDQFTLQTLAS